MEGKFSTEYVKKLAELATIAIKDNEEEKYAQEFESIFGILDKLQRVDTNGVEPLSCPTEKFEEIGESLLATAATTSASIETTALHNQEEITQSAPIRYDGYFVVPRTIE